MSKLKLTPNLLSAAMKGMLGAIALTVPMWFIGRNVLGEAVIGLLYLAPIAWAASRWGQVSGISSALTAALCFDFLFIPPFYTFAIGSLEGWLVLVIFLTIAVVVIGRIQESLLKVRHITFMYELSSSLGNARTQEAAARVTAGYIRQLYQAARVNVLFRPISEAPWVLVSEPAEGERKSKPDRVLPIMNVWGLIGEIHIWQGDNGDLPPADDQLLQNFAEQTARALERARSMEDRAKGHILQTEKG